MLLPIFVAHLDAGDFIKQALLRGRTRSLLIGVNLNFTPIDCAISFDNHETVRTLQRALGTHSSPMMKAITAAFGDLPPAPSRAYGAGPGCGGIAGRPAPTTTY